jgi:hypothetical protein
LQRHFGPKAGHFSDRPRDGQNRFEPLYAFTNGMATDNDTSGESGIDFKYGATPNLQSPQRCRFNMTSPMSEPPFSDPAMSSSPQNIVS